MSLWGWKIGAPSVEVRHGDESDSETAIAGTYYSFDFAEYGHRYLAEVQYRLNRRFDMSAILGRLLDALRAAAPCPERRIRAAEDSC